MEQKISSDLHVLSLTPFYPSRGDDVSGCFVAESLRSLADRGITSSVIAVDSIYHPRRAPSAVDAAEWLRYPQLPGNFGLATAGHFLASAIMGRVRHIHRRSPISLIHAHAALPCGHAASILARKLGIPFVVTIHGLDVFNRCFEDGRAARWRRRSSISVYQNASRTICISKKILHLLKGEITGEPELEVVYNGTDPEMFSPGEESAGPPTLLSIGTLLVGKGHGLALHAMAGLKDSNPDLRLQIIGEGKERVLFEHMAQDLGIADRVEFIGRRNRAEVAAAMRACTIFVLPSRFEGLGCVYLEAMACGKPAIGCWGQGIDEIIQHGINGWLIPVDGLEELIHGLRSLLASNELRKKIGIAARQTILGALTYKHQTEHLIRIYRDVAR